LEKGLNDLLVEKNKLIAERDARPNITNKEWINKQNELKETKIKRDKLFDLCFELIELIKKILSENEVKNAASFWGEIERIKLVLELVVISASAVITFKKIK
jgi:hypothetical protein